MASMKIMFNIKLHYPYYQCLREFATYALAAIVRRSLHAAVDKRLARSAIVRKRLQANSLRHAFREEHQESDNLVLIPCKQNTVSVSFTNLLEEASSHLPGLGQ